MRELTAETIIRVKAPLPLPRKRELTGETRIRLSQIVDLKDLVLEMAQDEAAPEGTVHHWSDGDHIKKNGKWVPVQKNLQKQEEPRERQLASKNISSTYETGYMLKYIEKLYGKGKYCPSIKDFVTKSKCQEYKKGTPVLTKNNIDIEPEITEGLETLKKLTGVKFKHVIFLDSSKGLPGDTIATTWPADPFRETLIINKENPYWFNKRAQTKLLKDSSTKMKAHLFLHEAGHKKLAMLRESWDNTDDENLARQMSEIAARKPDEFQSELYAMKHAGLEVKQEFIELYEKYGGNYADV